jgi:hypothetical protein
MPWCPIDATQPFASVSPASSCFVCYCLYRISIVLSIAHNGRPSGGPRPWLCFYLALLAMLRPFSAASETVPLERRHGTYIIPVQINGALVLLSCWIRVPPLLCCPLTCFAH